MSKTSPPTTKPEPEWIDVSSADDTPTNAGHKGITSGNAAERATDLPPWALYTGCALCALALIWVTSFITTRRLLTERPPLHIETSATVAPSNGNSKTLLTAPQSPTPATAQIMVHVTGQVKKPGVYELEARSRLRDAVHLAGGPLPDADLEAVNLAEFLSDGQQYKIPRRTSSTQTQTSAPANRELPSAHTARSARVERAEPAPPAPRSTTKTAPRTVKNALPSTPLDLNHATAIELDTLPDIGPTKAARIVEYRTQNGAFQSVEDLVEVEGIGEKTLEKLRPYVVVR